MACYARALLIDTSGKTGPWAGKDVLLLGVASSLLSAGGPPPLAVDDEGK